MSTSDQILDQATQNGPVTVTYGGAVTSFALWGLQISEIGVLISAFVAICGLALQFYVTVKREKRAREEHKVKLESMRNGATANKKPGKTTS